MVRAALILSVTDNARSRSNSDISERRAHSLGRGRCDESGWIWGVCM